MIKGNIVNLKQFSLKDLEFLYKWNNNPEYSGKFEPYESCTKEELAIWLNLVKPEEFWYIIENKNHEKVGQIVGRKRDKSSIEIGYRVIPEARNKGYCTDAVKAFVKHLLEKEKFKKVIANTNPENKASRLVLIKAGFNEVGYREKGVKINNVWMDGVIYEITQKD